MNNLPVELLARICEYLNFADLLTLKQINRNWHLFLKNEFAWSQCKCEIGNGGFLTSFVHFTTARIKYPLNERFCSNIQWNLAKVTELTTYPIRLFDDYDSCILFPYLMNLISLDLRCTDVTDASIRLLGANMKKLKYLNIANCRQLTDISFKIIGNQLNLVTLDISATYCVTNESWLEFCANASTIQRLSMMNQIHFKWDVVGVVTPPSLRYWDISRNYAVCFEALKCIISYRMKLGLTDCFEINVRDCELLTKDEIEELYAMAPSKGKLFIHSNAILKNHNEDGIREYINFLIRS